MGQFQSGPATDFTRVEQQIEINRARTPVHRALPAEFLLNLLLGNQMAGIMLSGAGPANLILDNSIVSNGRFGITNGGTNGTFIEGNRVSYNGGPWGSTPYGSTLLGKGRGISVSTSDGVVVFDNRVRGNSEVDIFWDSAGSNKFDSNACDSSAPAGACGPSTQK